MNAVEIEQAVSELFATPFAAAEFPYQFLEAFGNKATTIKRLKSGDTNKSDCGGVLQTKNIHILTAAEGDTPAALQTLKASPATERAKARFVLATDGSQIEAEDLITGEHISCAYTDFPDHFGFFLALAGISTVQQIRDSAFDIRATSRLNRLYVELIKTNPEWGADEKRHDMNHFMARLIFCFFAEDTGIFNKKSLFTDTIAQISARDSSNTDFVIREIFRAMNTQHSDRPAAKLPAWASQFPYVNGGLFSDSPEVPRLSKTARTYLINIGSLDWTQINPDIFGSMIQAVADDEERGELGMHYTSVPNILKVLNPLFLDDIRAKLADAGGNKIKLLNLRKRLARIRVFDPACGSGNFLVIAYREMRQIENQINEQRGEKGRKSDIPITNFRGIELRDFSAEIARLALIIAEYQANVKYLGQLQALQAFLPLSSQNWITCGNALRLDWLAVCPPASKTAQILSDDLFTAPTETDGIEFANAGGETYICGNPPYKGSKKQNNEQKADLQGVFAHRSKNWKSLDYVAGWFIKAADYMQHNSHCAAAFVSTNSICQGQQVPILWSLMFSGSLKITFAHQSFKWANLASHNAGVTVVIVGFSNQPVSSKKLYSIAEAKFDGSFQFDGTLRFDGTAVRKVENINAYLVAAPDILVFPQLIPISCDISHMQFGNHPYYATALTFSQAEARKIIVDFPEAKKFIRPFSGSKEFIDSSPRACLWISDEELAIAEKNPEISRRINLVKESRTAATNDKTAQKLAATPHKFREQMEGKNRTFIIPRVSSENREYLPVGLLEPFCIVQEKAFALYDAPLWNMALIASRLHWVWIGTVCVRMRTDFSYSNTLGWNTFPVPLLTTQNKLDLTRCTEDILLAREAHFPATIADLYTPEAMPENLRQAHERNDETIERIYIGRRFKNDTERLEKLFALYTKMHAAQPAEKPKRKKKAT